MVASVCFSKWKRSRHGDLLKLTSATVSEGVRGNAPPEFIPNMSLLLISRISLTCSWITNRYMKRQIRKKITTHISILSRHSARGVTTGSQVSWDPLAQAVKLSEWAKKSTQIVWREASTTENWKWMMNNYKNEESWWKMIIIILRYCSEWVVSLCLLHVSPREYASYNWLIRPISLWILDPFP